MNRLARLSLFVLGPAVLGIAFGTWVYFAPHLTVRAMRLAAERGDAKAVARHVDFPALRADLKLQLAQTVGERLEDYDDTGALSGLGVHLAKAMGGPMIDAMVSPQAITLMFTGRGLARNGLTAFFRSDAGAARAGGGVDLPEWQATMAYEDFDTFAVNLSADGDPPMATIPSRLVFKRSRLLWWKLSAVDLTPR